MIHEWVITIPDRDVEADLVTYFGRLVMFTKIVMTLAVLTSKFVETNINWYGLLFLATMPPAILVGLLVVPFVAIPNIKYRRAKCSYLEEDYCAIDL